MSSIGLFGWQEQFCIQSRISISIFILLWTGTSVLDGMRLKNVECLLMKIHGCCGVCSPAMEWLWELQAGVNKLLYLRVDLRHWLGHGQLLWKLLLFSEERYMKLHISKNLWIIIFGNYIHSETILLYKTLYKALITSINWPKWRFWVFDKPFLSLHHGRGSDWPQPYTPLHSPLEWGCSCPAQKYPCFSRENADVIV